MTDSPSADALHKRAERARRRAQGLKRIEVWIDPRIERTLRAFIRSAFEDKPMAGRLHVGERITPENAAEFAREFGRGVRVQVHLGSCAVSRVFRNPPGELIEVSKPTDEETRT